MSKDELSNKVEKLQTEKSKRLKVVRAKLEPMVERYRAFLGSDGAILITDVAKALGLSGAQN